MFISVSQYCKRIGSRFLRSEDGNVAITLGIAIIPIMAVVGVSIDYGRAAAARSAMQAAADATALMISKEAPGSTAANLNTKAVAYFKALVNRPDITGLSVNAVYTASSTSGQSIKVDASGSVANSFMSMAQLGGTKTTAVSTSSTVRWGARYRVALALDNTGSMASANKMTELKKAASKMISDFAAMAQTTDDVYISIVPFAVGVNVDPANTNQNWLSWDAEYYGWCKNTLWGTKDTTLSRQNKTTCNNTNYRQWQAYVKKEWTGCVPDRDYKNIGNNDQTNTLPNVSAKETLWDPVQMDNCPVPMMGMTSAYSKKQDLIDKVNAMISAGNTNQGIGLSWAWMTHTIGAGPFPAPAKDSTMEYKDVIILLSDGDNTENRWSQSDTTIDARQATLCNNIKSSKKIDIYTVQVATSGDAIQPVLKNCATFPNDPTYFSYITNADQLSTKFKDIFESIARLRVTN